MRLVYDKIVSLNDRGNVVQNIPWNDVELLLSNEDGRTQAFMNLLIITPYCNTSMFFGWGEHSELS